MCRAHLSQTAEQASQSKGPKMEPRKKILTALNNVMLKVGYIQKSSENKFHGYRYASEADLLEKLRPVMIEEGLILIPSVELVRPIDDFGNTTIDMKYTLAHKDGEVWPEPIRISGCGNDRNKSGNVGDKGLYKAITGANKYLLFKLFQIETGDDPEKDENAPQAPQQQAAQPATNGDEITDEQRKTYIAMFLMALSKASSQEEVRELWNNEKENRKTMKIMNGDLEYANMKEACTKRVNELKQKKG
jgi:ERF superfamily